MAVIEMWHRLIDSLLPFSWAHYDFMKNALLAVLFVTPLFAILGTMVVNNRMVFFTDVLGHSNRLYYFRYKRFRTAERRTFQHRQHAAPPFLP